MGCNVSRLDSQGVAFPARLRPLLLQRFEEIKARRNSGNPIKEKVLLSHVDPKHISQQLLLLSPKGPKNEDALTDGDEDELEVDDDEDDDGHERMIGHEGDDAFPGSPSFRVYFNENEVDDLDVVIGKKDGVEEEPVSRDGGILSKDPSVEKKVKRNKRKRSFKKVLPKNLLFVKSCYTPSPSTHDNSHLLPAGKTTV